ncbi:MAG: lipid-A-disaccharide synthase [Candidatus Sericytochromatia bacterium]|nr:lipid-A-disaccharide synthase [Candidatus Sericytochromatia bacterium]
MSLFPETAALSTSPSPLIFLSAGEVSGDIYASQLAQALLAQTPGCRLIGIGGPRMLAAGVQLLADPLSRSAVGLSENLPGLPWFWQLFLRLRTWLRTMRPQAVVLVDFQGLNLKLAEVARSLGIPVIYYIAPQDWLWGLPQSADRLVALTDLILAVFEPEYRYYLRRGARVEQVGHPLLDLLPARQTPAQARLALGLNPEQRVICLMPGSRQLEVERLWPVLTELALRFQAEGALCLCPLAEAFLQLPALPPGLQLLPADKRYAAMQAADLVIGASGNMVLEAALLQVPVIALYRVSGLTYAVASRLLKVKHITLPNILLGQGIVPEFVQNLALDPLLKASHALLARPEIQLAQLQPLCGLLAPSGAAERAAGLILAETVARAEGLHTAEPD